MVFLAENDVACKKRKTPRPLRQGVSRPVFSKFPNHTVAIDIVGPTPESSEGNLWILTMIDSFTQWPLAVAIPNRRSSLIGKVDLREKGRFYLTRDREG